MPRACSRAISASTCATDSSHAGFVGAIGEVEVADVVPGAHAHAAVDRHRAHRRMREHEADRRPVAVAPAPARSARNRGRRRRGRAATAPTIAGPARFRARRFQADRWCPSPHCGGRANPRVNWPAMHCIGWMRRPLAASQSYRVCRRADAVAPAHGTRRCARSACGR